MVSRTFPLIACLLAAHLIPGLAAAQPAPRPGATIVAYSALDGNDPNALANEPAAGSGPLRLTFSDGTVLTIPNERGDMNDGASIVRQSVFETIRLAPDHRTIGWLADYMMCAQSYPCPLELVMFRAGAPLRKIPPSYGIFWGWMFTDHGRRVITHSGFPHGDNTGAYALFDTATGRRLATFAPPQPVPAWAKPYLASDNP